VWEELLNTKPGMLPEEWLVWLGREVTQSISFLRLGILENNAETRSQGQVALLKGSICVWGAGK
jgi:hypothetical protein